MVLGVTLGEGIASCEATMLFESRQRELSRGRTAMTFIVALKLNDGLVFAADSCTVTGYGRFHQARDIGRCKIYQIGSHAIAAIAGRYDIGDSIISSIGITKNLPIDIVDLATRLQSSLRMRYQQTALDQIPECPDRTLSIIIGGIDQYNALRMFNLSSSNMFYFDPLLVEACYINAGVSEYLGAFGKISFDPNMSISEASNLSYFLIQKTREIDPTRVDGPTYVGTVNALGCSFPDENILQNNQVIMESRLKTMWK